jgi:hypothetical protein
MSSIVVTTIVIIEYERKYIKSLINYYYFFVQVYRGLKSCTSLLENVNLCVPPSNLNDFSLFGVCPSNEHCPSARCAYAANVVGKDLDIFVIGAVTLNHIYAHQHKIVSIISSQS